MAINRDLVTAITRNRKIQKKQRRGRAAPPPISPEVAYRKSLLQVTALLKKITEEIVFPALTSLEPQYFALDTPRQEMLQIVETLQGDFSALNEQAIRAAQLMTEQVNTHNSKNVSKMFVDAFGINLPAALADEGVTDVIESSIDENVKLITSIAEEYQNKMKKMLSAGITNNESAPSIRDNVRDLFGVTDRRAKLIARDQVSKLNGALTKTRQQNVGIDSYIWRTREDDLVRETHRQNNGETFEWASPPADTGHPGEDINCRCVAIPILTI